MLNLAASIAMPCGPDLAVEVGDLSRAARERLLGHLA